MEFAAVPLAASVANVETVEMGSAVVTDATESSLSETPEAPPVPQIPRGRPASRRHGLFRSCGGGGFPRDFVASQFHSSVRLDAC